MLLKSPWDDIIFVLCHLSAWSAWGHAHRTSPVGIHGIRMRVRDVGCLYFCQFTQFKSKHRGVLTS